MYELIQMTVRCKDERVYAGNYDNLLVVFNFFYPSQMYTGPRMSEVLPNL